MASATQRAAARSHAASLPRTAHRRGYPPLGRAEAAPRIARRATAASLTRMRSRLRDFPRLIVSLRLVAATLLAASCRHAPPVTWANRPLGPTITFGERVGPRTLVVLVLDAHSGTPVFYSAVTATVTN